MGKYEPEEHPFTGIGRMIAGIGEVKKAVPEMVIFGSAPTYLRQFADLYTAGAVEEGFCDGMLFGRMAFADPDYANEIIKNGRIDPKRVCMTCGKCGDLIRAHKPTGCVIRDPKTFMPFYKEFLEIKMELIYQLRKIGVNINQIAKKYNENLYTAPSAVLMDRMDRVEAITKQIADTILKR